MRLVTCLSIIQSNNCQSNDIFHTEKHAYEFTQQSHTCNSPKAEKNKSPSIEQHMHDIRGAHKNSCPCQEE